MKHTALIFCLLFLATACKHPEARKPISRSSGTFIKESAERNKLLFENEKKDILAIIKKDSTNTYIASENGFWYTYHKQIENDTITPKFGDIVIYNYGVKDLNGNVIYSEEELKTQSYAMDQQELFSGLREGLKLMKAGEAITFIFPSSKAYGYYGDTKKIGTNIPIVTNVSVQSITKNKSN